MGVALDMLRQSWELVVQAAPYLLVGFVLAGLIHAFVPVTYVVGWLGAPRLRSVLNAALIGIPLPLCSCGVVPVAAALRRSGASKGATTAFLISTPESGADSIAVTYALMDPIMTIARPFAALFTALTAGVAQNLWGRGEAEGAAASDAPADASCCCHQSTNREADCCGTSPTPPVAAGLRAGRTVADPPRDPAVPHPARAGHHPPGWFDDPAVRASTGVIGRLRAALRYGLVEMFEYLAVYLVIGFLLAGVLSVLLQQFDLLRAALGSSWAPLLMLVAGIPIYVCATAATPVIAVLIGAGLSPGAGLVFLLAGPATNAASLVVLQGILGRRAIVIYLIGIGFCALLAGYALDAIYAAVGVPPRVLSGAHAHGEALSWMRVAAAAGLLACIGYGLYRRFRPLRIGAGGN